MKMPKDLLERMPRGSNESFRDWHRRLWRQRLNDSLAEMFDGPEKRAILALAELTGALE